MLVKVSSKGQITLPKAIREAMGIKPGDTIVVSQKNDDIVLHPVTATLFDLRGSIKVDGPQDFDAIMEKTKKAVADDIMRELKDE